MLKHRQMVPILVRYVVPFMYLLPVTPVNVGFQCNEEQCLNELVQLQCIVSNAGALVWRVRNEDYVSLGTRTYSANGNLQPSLPIATTVFSTDLSSTSPSIISNISFTVQSSINGYTIQCGDINDEAIHNCTIIITGFPSLSIFFSDKLILVMVLSSQCHGSITSYTVNSNTTNSTITTTDTSVTIPLDGLSAGVYCFSVAVVDTANRTGEYSKEKCFKLNVPLAPMVETSQNGHEFLTLSLVFSHLNMPPVTDAYISFQPKAVNQTLLDEYLLNNTTNFTYKVVIRRSISYTMRAYGKNALGNGSTSTITFPPSVAISTIFSTAISSVSPTDLPVSTGDNTIGVVVAVVVVVVCLILVVIIVVFIIIVVLKKKKTSNPTSEHEVGTLTPPTNIPLSNTNEQNTSAVDEQKEILEGDEELADRTTPNSIHVHKDASSENEEVEYGVESIHKDASSDNEEVECSVEVALSNRSNKLWRKANCTAQVPKLEVIDQPQSFKKENKKEIELETF